MVVSTGWLTSVGVRVAEVANIAIIVILTATGVGVLVTDRLGVGTVETIIVATWTAAICRSTVTTTEEAVVVFSVTKLVKTSTEGIHVTNRLFTLVTGQVAFVVFRTVVQVRATSKTLAIITIGTVFRGVRCWYIAHSIGGLTVRV